LRLYALLEVATRLRHRARRIRINTDGLANLVYGRDVTPDMEGLIDALSVSLNAQNAEIYNRHCRPKLPGSWEAMLDFVVGFFNRIGHFATYFVLATLFSFLILFDFPHLRAGVLALRETRFQDAFDETADSVAKYALVVGYTFQAQVGIAVLNTVLTTLGLLILKIETIALLASIVFFAGLIPVWGTFISSVPILLLAFNDGGISLGVKAGCMIGLVHFVEAYILNPRVVSAIFKINPLLTLIILYLGHNLFGIWGVLLGVPTAVYVYRYIILTPLDTGSGDPDQGDQNRIPSSPISNASLSKEKNMSGNP
jgi:predicted PurR-regulated permease PerM